MISAISGISESSREAADVRRPIRVNDGHQRIEILTDLAVD